MNSNLERRLERLERRTYPADTPSAAEKQRVFNALRARVESGQASPAERHRYNQVRRLLEKAKARRLSGFALELFKTQD